MSTPDRHGDEQPSFETFKLGWRIPPAILEPLLHPAVPAEQADAAPGTSSDAEPGPDPKRA
jgi:hypothetical protein